MTAKFFALLTHQGAAALSNAAALGTKVQITQMGVGDGGGTLPTPTGTQTALVNEKRRAVLNGLSVDAANSSQIIAEQIIPENEGGFWIREIGLYDSDNTLIAVANCPETYKPMLAEGSGRTQTVRMILIINSTDAVTLKIDPSVVLATRQYVDDKAIEVKTYADDLMAKHLGAANPHSQYAPKVSPALTGTPTAPTAVKGASSTQIASTAFVQTALSPLADAALPVGVPVPWPLATAPAGWLKCNGATFDKTKYSVLAAVFPSGNLPDLRGVFIRGWDDGRGLDSGRAVLSYATDKMRKHTHAFLFGNGTGPHTPAVYEGSRQSTDSLYYATAGSDGLYISEEGQNETAPCNIAFNYIVRAA
ncbi:phage tail protein [Ewingella sp. S1.OA.A_B6]